MSVTSLSDLAHQHMLNILGYGQTGQSTGTPSSLSIGGSTSNQLSPFAQMLTELQQMEESNPGQYAKLSQQISTNLSTEASTAQARGNTALASQLTKLSRDFSSASQSGQLPDVGDLEKMMNSGTSTALSAASQQAGKRNMLGQVLSLAGI